MRRLTTITADQIRKAAGYGKFSSDPARIVCRGLQQIAAGFRTGYTVQCILMDLKLIGPKGRMPTKLGREFLYDMYHDADPLLALRPATLGRDVPSAEAAELRYTQVQLEAQHYKEELREQERTTEHLGECLASLVSAAMGDQGETAGAVSYHDMTEAAYKAINRLRDAKDKAEAELAEVRKASGIVSRSQARRINESEQ